MKISRRSAHLCAGLTLFVYVLSHLLNHVLGVVSIDAMNAGRTYFIFPWTNLVGTLVLGAALLFHMFSALYVLYQRRTLTLPAWQWWQLLLGLSVPLLAVEHMVATGYARVAYDLKPSYDYVLASICYFDPTKGWVQMGLLCAAWGHAAVGIRNWIKVKSWYADWAPHLYVAAILIPAMALMGFISAALEVQHLASDPAWVRAMIAALGSPSGETVRMLYSVRDWTAIVYVSSVVLVFVARHIRLRIAKRREQVFVDSTVDGGRYAVMPGATVLETMHANGVKHASVCGGRARCSTCRVRIVRQAEGAIAPPADEELRVLKRLNLPPNVRLACQLRPTANITCDALLPPDVTVAEAMAGGNFTAGYEVELTVMFADLRGFTAMSENRLPFDVVYLLNQYFESMGQAIEAEGGTIDKFIGDGILATFGDDEGGSQDCGTGAALRAARAMGERLEEMNARLKNDLPEPLNIGIGLHTGPVIKGTMGYSTARQVTVIGDTVNTASRIESATKEHGAQLLFTETVSKMTGKSFDDHRNVRIQVRGRQEPLTVTVVERVAGFDLDSA